MVSNKLPSKESTENLLDLLETNKVKNKVNRDGTISSFVSVFKLKSGQQSISAEELFNLYKKWTKTPLTRSKFLRELKRYIEYTYKNGYLYFLIDFTCFNMTVSTKQKLIERPKTKSRIYTTHFENYLKFYGIKQGTFWLEDHILFHLYDKWTYKNKNRHPLSFIQFNKFCKLYFENKTKYFGVNKEILNHLTPEHLQQLREKTNEKRKKESNKKKF